MQKINEKRLYKKNLGMVSTWKKKKGKTSKFVDGESNNWNKRYGNGLTEKNER